MMAVVPREAIKAEWPRIHSMLAPAFARDKASPALEIYHRLASGEAVAIESTGDVDAMIVVSIGTPKDGDHLALWVEYVGGRVHGRHSRQLASMRGILRTLARIGAENGCSELRAELGRKKWGCLSPDFRLMSKGGRDMLVMGL